MKWRMTANAGAAGAAPELFQQILVALDGSVPAEQVLPFVESLAQKYGSTVTLLQATPAAERYVARAIGSGDVAAVDLMENERRAADRYLRSTALELAARLPGTRVKRATPKGDAAHEIVKKAAQTDLVVMATHGRRGVGRFLHGSVAEYVLRHAPCPVLLVRLGADAAQKRPAPQRARAESMGAGGGSARPK